jgi:hypothetical protein
MNPRLFHRLRAVRFWLHAMGLDPLATLKTLQGLPRYFSDLRMLRRQARDGKDAWPIFLNAPCLTDWSQEGGVASGQYFHQDLLIAQRIFESSPMKHVDVGSRVDGFVAHVAAFREIEVFDIRPITANVRNITFRQCDFMSLAPELSSYCDSLSCLHALEHFGLGRYNDPVSYRGYEVGLDNLVTLLRPGGTLYLSVPIGPQRIEFNGHRVFSIETILALAKPSLDLSRLSYVDDHGDLHHDVKPNAQGLTRSFDVHYGCGIFEFVKR